MAANSRRTPVETSSGPTPLTGRAPAPDLARGVMLLLICVANAPWYLWAAEAGSFSAHPVGAAGLDLVAQTVAIVAVDGRIYPMFAFLFGYGIVQLYRRQHDAEVPQREARRLLRRRHWLMLAFGFAHAALLWMGDIIGAYGLAGLLLVWWFVDRRDRTIRIWLYVLGALLLVTSVLTAALGWTVASVDIPTTDEAFVVPEPTGTSDYAQSVLLRIGFWLALTPVQGLLGLVVPMAILLAFLAGRHRVLESPERHLPLLRRIAVVGIGTGWGVGILVALQNVGALGLSRDADWAFSAINSAAGLLCGLGYVAVFGLIAARRGTRLASTPARALEAVGKRSLTCYLAQSVIFAPIMSAWGLGLGQYLGSWTIMLAAIGTWLITVLLAVLLERAGRRGPAEWALRRLVYPRRREGRLPSMPTGA